MDLSNDPDIALLRERYLRALALAESIQGEGRAIMEDQAQRLRDQLGDLVLFKLGWSDTIAQPVSRRHQRDRPETKD